MPEPKHLLLVEDDSAQRYLLARHLEKAGFKVTLARDPTAALQLAKRDHFDLVITDYCLPYSTGTDLVNRLRETDGHATTPVVLWTVMADELNQRATREDLPGPVVPKSSPVTHLLDVVSGCLAAANPAT